MPKCNTTDINVLFSMRGLAFLSVPLLTAKGTPATIPGTPAVVLHTALPQRDIEDVPLEMGGGAEPRDGRLGAPGDLLFWRCPLAAPSPSG